MDQNRTRRGRRCWWLCIFQRWW